MTSEAWYDEADDRWWQLVTDADTGALSLFMRSEALASSAQELLYNQSLQDLLKYCFIVVSTLPILVLYPFVKKYFVKGVMIGAVKG